VQLWALCTGLQHWVRPLKQCSGAPAGFWGRAAHERQNRRARLPALQACARQRQQARGRSAAAGQQPQRHRRRARGLLLAAAAAAAAAAPAQPPAEASRLRPGLRGALASGLQESFLRSGLLWMAVRFEREQPRAGCRPGPHSRRARRVPAAGSAAAGVSS